MDTPGSVKSRNPAPEYAVLASARAEWVLAKDGACLPPPQGRLGCCDPSFVSRPRDRNPETGDGQTSKCIREPGVFAPGFLHRDIVDIRGWVVLWCGEGALLCTGGCIPGFCTLGASSTPPPQS